MRQQQQLISPAGNFSKLAERLSLLLVVQHPLNVIQLLIRKPNPGNIFHEPGKPGLSVKRDIVEIFTLSFAIFEEVVLLVNIEQISVQA